MIRLSRDDRDPDLPAPLRDHAVASEPIEAGVSSSLLERLTRPDGRRLVAKRIDAELDWMMRATGDTGLAAELWVNGATDRLPSRIDPAIVRIEDDNAGGWLLYMDDVSLNCLQRTRLAPGAVTASSRVQHLVTEAGTRRGCRGRG